MKSWLGTFDHDRERMRSPSTVRWGSLFKTSLPLTPPTKPPLREKRVNV